MVNRDRRESNQKTIDMLNGIAVTKEELLTLVTESEKYSGGEPGGGLFLIAKLYKGSPQKAQAVYFRMEALSQLLVKNGAPGWTLPPAEDGSILTQAAVFSAAALEPLAAIEDDIGFEQESFLRRVLAEADTEGTA
jgi:hypothetical protein